MNTEKIKLIVNRKDADGNRLAYDESTGALQMSQSNEPNRWRPIGKLIHEDDLVIYSKYEKEKDKYRKYKAWSVYYVILEICDAVRYETESFVYFINKADLFKYGAMVKDKGHGNGSKIVCPIRHWTVFPKNKRFKSLLNQLGYEWFDELYSEFSSENMKRTSRFVKKDRSTNIVYPKSEDIFKPFKLCPYTQTKVVLLDFAPLNDGSANGLAFSQDEVLNPHESTKALLDWIEEDVYDGFNLNRNSDLTTLAQSGTLLLNSCFTCNNWGRTVHKDAGWEEFNKVVMKRLITDKLHTPVCFILLGSKIIDTYKDFLEPLVKNSKHLLLTGNYPGIREESIEDDPKIFSKCLEFLKSNGLDPVAF